ncbi:MAG: Formate efflux transporter (TC 2.A.44 family) [uncultured Solirubrobacteraceae bacterium]|uniref:Formate efflux transporter (TC 2.A.44 family) n=1 Tax=uncultured Solirubrobacteraceae bacterium TaxID=1162706 RepID=A0A6J4T336_9ACTN|nr:MAG: Formate efflux transporter (TC 2.A.44 family) [uncultured Solirubrobacteraceae bacterium]
MSGRNPHEIWDETVDEGERRLTRGAGGLLSTGALGGVDVMLGVMALAVVSGGLGEVLPESVAHLGGSLVFGIGLVLVVIGRSELFTENFLVPVGAVLQHRVRASALPRLWGFTMAGNLIAMAILALVLTQAGLVPPETLRAAGQMSDTFAERDWLGAGLSAVVAGTVMTLFTWLTHAVERDSARILIALLIGFLLAAPSLNHAIVGFGEMAFGVMAGTTETAEWVDVAQNFPIAVAGNLLGGLGFVTLTRILQVRGEPAHDPTAS